MKKVATSRASSESVNAGMNTGAFLRKALLSGPGPSTVSASFLPTARHKEAELTNGSSSSWMTACKTFSTSSRLSSGSSVS